MARSAKQESQISAGGRPSCVRQCEKISVFMKIFQSGAVIFSLAVLSLIFTGCSSQVAQQPQSSLIPATPPEYQYRVAFHPGASAYFSVRLKLPPLGPQQRFFHFSTIGVYAPVGLGSLVKRFRAEDARGREATVRRRSENTWEFSNPSAVRVIEYDIADTWGSPELGQAIPEMVGTRIDSEYVFLSSQAVFGFIEGLEFGRVQVEFDLPDWWTVCSALPQDDRGRFYAQHYGQLTTSPFLLGDLDVAEEYLRGSRVRFFLFSRDGQNSTPEIIPLTENILNATEAFLGDLPIDDYTMLFVFDDRSAGGVEYPQSAAFVFRDRPLEEIRPQVQDVIAHEYFHLIIPYSIRSDRISKFNLLRSRPSQHLWFFEGVTEWASDMIQLRYGLKNIREYFLNDVRPKLFREERFGSEISLREISLSRRRAANDYLNVYSRGALVALLFDIHLLERTWGRRGLREVINDLRQDFGPDHPLPEERFFEILIDYSGPEFEDFIRDYIAGNKPLPVKEMLHKIGIDYQKERRIPNPGADLGVFPVVKNGKVVVQWVDLETGQQGLRKGDVLQKIAGRPVHPGRLDYLFSEFIPSLSIGRVVEVQIARNGLPATLSIRLISQKARHVFSIPRLLTPNQRKIRDIWLKNR